MSKNQEDVGNDLAASKTEKTPTSEKNEKPSAAAEDILTAGNKLLSLITKKKGSEDEGAKLAEIDTILAAHNVANYEKHNNSIPYTRSPLLRAINKRHIEIVKKVVVAGGKITDEVLMYALTEYLPAEGSKNSRHRAEFRAILDYLLEKSKNYNFTNKIKLKGRANYLGFVEFSGLSYIIKFGPKDNLFRIFLENGALVDKAALVNSLNLQDFALFDELLKKYLAVNPLNEVGPKSQLGPINILSALDEAASSLGLGALGRPINASYPFSLDPSSAGAAAGAGGGGASSSSSTDASSAPGSASASAISPVKRTLIEVFLEVCCQEDPKEGPNSIIAEGEAAASVSLEAVSPVSFYAKVAETLIRLGVDPNYYHQEPPNYVSRNKSGPFLLTAVDHGQRDVAGVLLSNGAKVDQPLANGLTALMRAIEKNDKLTAQLLLRYGANIRATTKESAQIFGNKAVIEFAVKPWKSKMVDLLLDENLPPDTLAHNMPIVFHAVENGDEIVLAKLITKNAKLNTELEYGFEKVIITPFKLAALLQKSALIKIMHTISTVSESDKHTAIWWAVTYGDQAMFDELLSKLTPPIWTMNALVSPLILAIVTHRNLPFAQKLIQLGLFIQWTDGAGKNALQYEMQNPAWDSAIVRGLIEKGLSANTLLENGETPIFLAIRRDDEALVNFLMANGADLNHLSTNGNSPLNETMHSKKPKYLTLFLGPATGLSEPSKQRALYTAVGHGDQDALLALLNKTENLPWAFPNVLSPLVFALTRRNAPAAQAFIEKDRFINWVNANQEGALIYAIRSEMVGIVKLLMAKAVDCTTLLNGGVAPFHIACQAANHEIFQLIVGKTPDLSITDNEEIGGLHYALISRKFRNAFFLMQNGIGITKVSKNGMHALHVLFSILSKENLKNYRSEKDFTVVLECIKNTLLALLRRGCLIDGEAVFSATERATPEQILAKSSAEAIKLITESPLVLPGQPSVANRNSIWTSQGAKTKAIALINEISTIYRYSMFLMVEASKKEARVFSDKQQEDLSKILTSVLQGSINGRRISDGKTALHLAVENNNSPMASILICSGANIKVLDKKQQSALSNMSKELLCIQIVSQDLAPKLRQLRDELEKDYLAEEQAKEQAKTKDKEASKKPDELLTLGNANAKDELAKIRQKKIAELISIGKKIIQEFEKIDPPYNGLESSASSSAQGGGGAAFANGLDSGALSGGLEDDVPSVSRLVFIQFKDKLCFIVGSIFYQPEQIRPWFNDESLEIAETILSKISKGSTCYTAAHTILYRLQNLHKRTTKENLHEQIRKKIQTFLNTHQITLPADPNLRTQRELDHMNFVRDAAEYVLGDSIGGFRGHKLLDSNFIMELLESFRNTQNEKQALALENEKLLLQIKALKEGRSGQKTDPIVAPSSSAAAASPPPSASPSASASASAAASTAVAAIESAVSPVSFAAAATAESTVPKALLPSPGKASILAESPADVSASESSGGSVCHEPQKSGIHKRKFKDVTAESADGSENIPIVGADVAAGGKSSDDGLPNGATDGKSPVKKLKRSSKKLPVDNSALGAATSAAATIGANAAAAANGKGVYFSRSAVSSPVLGSVDGGDGVANLALVQQALNTNPNIIAELSAQLNEVPKPKIDPSK